MASFLLLSESHSLLITSSHGLGEIFFKIRARLLLANLQAKLQYRLLVQVTRTFSYLHFVSTFISCFTGHTCSFGRANVSLLIVMKFSTNVTFMMLYSIKLLKN